MRAPTFLQGALVALALSFFGAALFAALTTLVSGAAALRFLIGAVTLAYVGYLLSRSGARVGRVTALALTVAVAGVTWGFAPPLALYLMIHAGLIWLVRSLYFYSGVLPALMDLGLCALALAAGAWATIQSGSVFLSLWCFFLVQALHVAIPRSMERVRERDASVHSDARFQRARRTAEAAVARLTHPH